MKTISLSCTALFILLVSCKAQTATEENNEFKKYDNGLIYDKSTMQQLTHIVDSLNLKFKRCDLTRNYYAISQGIGNFIKMEKVNVREALADIKNNISFSEFSKKYPTAKINKTMLVTRSTYKDDYAKKQVVEFSGQVMNDEVYANVRIDNKPAYFTMALEGKWIFDYTAKTKDWDESLEAFYFTDEFKTTKIPEKYARMILYSDCVIDTTEDIYTGKAEDYESSYSSFNDTDKNSKLSIFRKYLEDRTAHITEKDVPASYQYKWHAMDSMKKLWIEKNVVPTEKFKQLLADAVNEVKEKKSWTNDEFENYVAVYDSKADALAMKRNRLVMGQCSMDQSPRYHALNIAMLSAETINWQVFLRAHLNIMNDRFDRMSDGSWAYAKRKTYIKELESLNIDVSDLLLGISLRINNPVQKHYFGSIGRLGRSIAESKNRLQFETQLADIIGDDQLDPFNRMLMHYLYLNYIYNLPNKEDRFASLAKLEAADKKLPVYLSSRIKLKKKDFEDRD